MRYARRLMVCALAALWGCGDGGGDTGPPPPVDVTGGWSFRVSNLSTPGIPYSCGMTGTMQLSQAASAFNGTYFVSVITCTDGSSGGPAQGQVVGGSVYAGDSVHFHFDDEDLDQHGIVSSGRTSMSGRSTWVVSDGTTSLTFTGQWSAHR